MAALQSLIFLSRKTRIKTGWAGGFDRLNHQLRQAQLVKQGLRCVLVETRLIASLQSLTGSIGKTRGRMSGEVTSTGSVTVLIGSVTALIGPSSKMRIKTHL